MNLDLQQQAAVTTQSRRALVVAGAGSGKTRVLTERIAYLTENHVSPFEILCWTFTRKAAGEMRERLEKRIGSKAHNITMGTMHAVGLRMLQRFGEVLGLRPDNITVYSAWEEEYLLKEVAREIGFLKKSWSIPKKNIDAMFSDYYERGVEPGELDPIKPLFDAFIQRCRENNALTYGGLLTGLRLLIPTMAKHLHIKHILVDEVQDLDPIQWAIINELNRAFLASLFVVGDADQSIYSFRGAVPEYIIEHQHEFDIYHLETNYRSVPGIVEASNRLIRNNVQRIDKTMVAARSGAYETADDVQTWKGVDSAWLANHLELWGDDQRANTAILARVHALLKKLSMELATRGVPHTYVGQKSALTNSEEFRRFHAFLKLTVNPCDNFAFLLIKDLIGLDAADYSLIRVKAATDGLSHLQALKTLQDVGKLWSDTFEHLSCTDLVSILLGLETMLTYSSQWLPGFAEAQIFAIEWSQQNPNGTIKQYLDWLATYDLQDELSEDQDGLVLMTVHAAKGLEWPNVIIAGANEGICPSKQAIAADEISEERRLMYVAMTRARDQLVVTVRPERTEKDDRVCESPMSRFVGEML